MALMVNIFICAIVFYLISKLDFSPLLTIFVGFVLMVIVNVFFERRRIHEEEIGKKLKK